jgi:hypothetical protein
MMGSCLSAPVGPTQTTVGLRTAHVFKAPTKEEVSLSKETPTIPQSVGLDTARLRFVETVPAASAGLRRCLSAIGRKNVLKRTFEFKNPAPGSGDHKIVSEGRMSFTVLSALSENGTSCRFSSKREA